MEISQEEVKAPQNVVDHLKKAEKRKSQVSITANQPRWGITLRFYKLTPDNEKH